MSKITSAISAMFRSNSKAEEVAEPKISQAHNKAAEGMIGQTVDTLKNAQPPKITEMPEAFKQVLSAAPEALAEEIKKYMADNGLKSLSFAQADINGCISAVRTITLDDEHRGIKLESSDDKLAKASIMYCTTADQMNDLKHLLSDHKPINPDEDEAQPKSSSDHSQNIPAPLIVLHARTKSKSRFELPAKNNNQPLRATDEIKPLKDDANKIQSQTDRGLANKPKGILKSRPVNQTPNQAGSEITNADKVSLNTASAKKSVRFDLPVKRTKRQAPKAPDNIKSVKNDADKNNKPADLASNIASRQKVKIDPSTGNGNFASPGVESKKINKTATDLLKAIKENEERIAALANLEAVAGNNSLLKSKAAELSEKILIQQKRYQYCAALKSKGVYKDEPLNNAQVKRLNEIMTESRQEITRLKAIRTTLQQQKQ
ncbi:hypothetical protein GW590_06350 [Rahnella sp. SAP-1]|uniref:Uncharacterized protein n=1 Tax=Rouxiella aceris TaxID=2703884 RepID=A0A848MDY2_9GAMM|nr:hypothetical protein [Rouxiella aceris]NMP26488.1 hypothetical protein [Rouxiella aceris]